jgi:hypothetical protein
MQSVASQVIPAHKHTSKEYLNALQKKHDISTFTRSVVRHATVSDLKPLGPFIGSLTAATGPQEGYDIFPPQGEGVTVYDERYFSTASADTAKKRREAMAGGRRGRARQQEGIGIDPVHFLQTLEVIFGLPEDDRQRNEVLAFLQSPEGSGAVRQLEVRTNSGKRKLYLIYLFVEMGPTTYRVHQPVPKCQDLSLSTCKSETATASWISRSKCG